MGEQLNNIEFPFGPIVSVQVVDLGKQLIGFRWLCSLYRMKRQDGPYKEDPDTRNQKLLDLYLNLPMEESKNTIVSAHNSVIRPACSNPSGKNLKFEEGGFFVFSKDNNKLYLEYKFYDLIVS